VTIRVLVVDDSAFVRTTVSRLLHADRRFEVVGQARNGAEACAAVAELRPDVVTMDYNMPGMNGAEATRAIMASYPTPIVMLSAHTSSGARETMAALGAGAVGFITKPDGEVSLRLELVREQLLRQLAEAARLNVRAQVSHLPAATEKTRPAIPRPPSTRVSPGRSAISRPPLEAGRRAMPAGLRLVVIAASTGGPAALAQVLPQLDLGSGVVLVVQHLPDGFTRALAAHLAETCGHPIVEAAQGELLEPGMVRVAPGGKHLEVERPGRTTLGDGAPLHGVRPAADLTFQSAARVFGPRVVGVLLTGMGRDGALGLAAVKAAGGRTVAQDASTCLVYGMPKAAVEMGVVDDVATLPLVAAAIRRHLA
jgi:two-component system chemotaxis response regulator CheB